MDTDVIQLYSLVGLRALAEYDLPEYRRVTDLSRNELEEKIRQLQTNLRGSEEPLLREIQARLAELELIEGEARSQTELSFLLKQLSSSCLQRAQQLSLLQGRVSRNEDAMLPGRAVRPDVERVAPQSPSGEDFVKLAAMRLLRTLPPYSADFNVRTKDVEVDCVLRPADSRLPVVFIEAKSSLKNDQVLKKALSQLKRASSGWGKGALQVVLTMAVDRSVAGAVVGDSGGSPYVLIYDQEANEFVGNNAEHLLASSIRRVQDSLA